MPCKCPKPKRIITIRNMKHHYLVTERGLLSDEACKYGAHPDFPPLSELIHKHAPDVDEIQFKGF